MERVYITAQKGFQQKFLSSSADICIGGGSAGAGKTMAVLMEPLRHIHNPNFAAIIFRRTYSDINNPGGLWDESVKMYPLLKAKPNKSDMTWTFPSGAYIKFMHLQHENNIYNHQGGQYPLIIFDELTHFTKKEFFYLISRNRSTCGTRPYVRATCNPDPESFIAGLIDWWIDPQTGFIIPERSGVIRYFTVDKDEYVWGATKQEVIDKCPHVFNNKELRDGVKTIDDLIKSFTFVLGKIYDNKILLNKDPGYLGNLLSQSEEEKLRLLEGNWHVKTDNLSIAKREKILDIFTNSRLDTGQKYITCDHARFGRDMCVIISWVGWTVDKIQILTTSDTNYILDTIASEKHRLGIGSSSIICDQDAIGVIDALRCRTFVGNGAALKVNGNPGNYKNLKTQCYYMLCEEAINNNLLSIRKNCFYVNGIASNTVSVNGKEQEIKKLIISDIQSARRKDAESDGKKQIISKEEQKNILQGRSPDFGDALSMRVVFELDQHRDIFLGYAEQWG